MKGSLMLMAKDERRKSIKNSSGTPFAYYFI
jgi:hypothetical protein